MRRWCWAAGGIGTVIVVVVVLVTLAVVRGGISARANPSTLEARAAPLLRQWAIPSEARSATNPILSSPRALAEGLAHFADHCATGHGNDGSGQTAIGRDLYPRAPDMRRRETQALTDGELFYIVENGVRLTGMPGWGGPGSAEGS